MTEAERLLWRALRHSRHAGLHFRKQVPIGPYIADFACHRARIVVELDGSQHGERRGIQHDAERTAFLESQGYRVLRFSNGEILADFERMAEYIVHESRLRLAPHP
jgi:very-short-patch-repair endonuclease